MSMMNFVSLLTANVTLDATKDALSFADRAKGALTMVAMGMGIIFAVLAIIMVVLMIMERIFAGKKEKVKKEVSAPAPTPAPAPAPVVETAGDDGAVIAAITAAISAMLAAENGDATYQGGFRVVSFKRSNRGTPWNSVK